MASGKFSTSRSSVGIQDLAKWQFCSSTYATNGTLGQTLFIRGGGEVFWL